MKSDIPKQYLDIAGKPMIFYALKALLSYNGIDKLWIVADEKWHGFIMDVFGLDSDLKQRLGDSFIGFVSPGDNRQLSIRNGLRDINRWMKESGNHYAGRNTVIIHDAVRPILPLSQLQSCYVEIEHADGVMPALPMKDTIYFSNDGRSVASLLDRNKVMAGQAPELFDFEMYYEANEALSDEEIMQVNGSTEVAIKNGMNVTMIPGNERNFKVTTSADLDRLRLML